MVVTGDEGGGGGGRPSKEEVGRWTRMQRQPVVVAGELEAE